MDKKPKFNTELWDVQLENNDHSKVVNLTSVMWLIYSEKIPPSTWSEKRMEEFIGLIKTARKEFSNDIAPNDSPAGKTRDKRYRELVKELQKTISFLKGSSGNEYRVLKACQWLNSKLADVEIHTWKPQFDKVSKGRVLFEYIEYLKGELSDNKNKPNSKDKRVKRELSVDEKIEVWINKEIPNSPKKMEYQKAFKVICEYPDPKNCTNVSLIEKIFNKHPDLSISDESLRKRIPYFINSLPL